jgi:hypothetical protein
MDIYIYKDPYIYGYIYKINGYKILGKTQESISRDPRSIAKPFIWICMCIYIWSITLSIYHILYLSSLKMMGKPYFC